MSKGTILYVKGMNVSDTESYVEEDSEEDIWDDTKLNQAYDKAVSMANAEIAKRVAMATNSSLPTEGKSEPMPAESEKVQKSKKKPKDTKPKPKSTSEWKVGMPCRAVYDADGLEYEAFLLRIVNNEDCVVRFLGYENSEVVAIGSLKPSRGNKERAQQIEEALNYNTIDEENEVEGSRMMDCDSERSQGTSDKRRRKKKTAKKTRKPSMEPPMDLPFRMPNLPNFGNIDFSSMQFPMAAPPPLPPSGDAEEQAMCSMLLSWYCSGYYTGLYQGMKRASQQQQRSGSSRT